MNPQKVEPRFRCGAYATAAVFGGSLFFYVLHSCYDIYGSEKLTVGEHDDWGSLPDFELCANDKNLVKWAFYAIVDMSKGGGFNVAGGGPAVVEDIGIRVREGPANSDYTYTSCVWLNTSSLSPNFPSDYSTPKIQIKVSYQPGSCVDSNAGALDIEGNDCRWSSCSDTYDDADFVAAAMCCACGGGGGWSPGLTNGMVVTSFDLLTVPSVDIQGHGRPQWLASIRPYASSDAVELEQEFRIEKLRHTSGTFAEVVTETYQLGSTNLETIANFWDPLNTFAANASELISSVTDPYDPDLFEWSVVLSFFKQTVTESTSVPWQWRIFRTVGHSGGYLASIGAIFALLFVRRYPYSSIACTYEELTLRGFQSKEVDVEIDPYTEFFLEESGSEMSDCSPSPR